MKDRASRAEVIYALHVIYWNLSFSSNSRINTIFREMFDDSELVKLYSMSSRKISYVITHGIAPYMKTLIIEDAKKTPFVFLFDETTSSQVKTQFDGYVQYFSEKFGKIVTRYLGSAFSGHCNADHLFKCFEDVLKIACLEKNYLI